MRHTDWVKSGQCDSTREHWSRNYSDTVAGVCSVVRVNTTDIRGKVAWYCESEKKWHFELSKLQFSTVEEAKAWCDSRVHD